jgi:sigma-B regulation protein RsbU (phosphoserine phosphatase)
VGQFGEIEVPQGLKPFDFVGLRFLRTARLPQPEKELEGDYRPAPGTYLDPVNARVDTGDYSYLLRFTEALNTTLDLRTLLKRTSELIRSVIQYRIFAILLLDETGKELRMRLPDRPHARSRAHEIPLGQGVVGQVAQTRKRS